MHGGNDKIHGLHQVRRIAHQQRPFPERHSHQRKMALTQIALSTKADSGVRMNRAESEQELANKMANRLK
jgi:hypothetical protein